MKRTQVERRTFRASPPPASLPLDREQRQFRELSAHLYRRPLLAREDHNAKLRQAEEPKLTPYQRQAAAAQRSSNPRPQWPKGARL